MRSRRMTIRAMALLIFSLCLPKAEAIEFNDGGTYNINYLETHVHVDQVAPGMMTTINLLDGGSIYKWWAYEDSRINICGGNVVSSGLVAYDRSHVKMSSGSINLFLNAHDFCKVDISGGSIHEFVVYDSSQASISGGSIEVLIIESDYDHADITGGSIDYLWSSGSSQVSISGGSIDVEVHTYGSSQTVISGGLISCDWVLESESKIKIVGSDFAVDGEVVGYGEITSVLGGSYGNEPVRHLTGTLVSGDLLNNDFRIGETAKIVLVPEPATLLLLGLGVPILRFRKN